MVSIQTNYIKKHAKVNLIFKETPEYRHISYEPIIKNSVLCYYIELTL